MITSADIFRTGPGITRLNLFGLRLLQLNAETSESGCLMASRRLAKKDVPWKINPGLGEWKERETGGCVAVFEADMMNDEGRRGSRNRSRTAQDGG